VFTTESQHQECFRNLRVFQESVSGKCVSNEQKRPTKRPTKEQKRPTIESASGICACDFQE
jgi:hypothetical protein